MRSLIALLFIACVAVGATLPFAAAQEPGPQGLEPDLGGQSNGRLRAEQVWTPEGVELACLIYEGVKVSPTQLGAEVRCYDETNWSHLVALSAQQPGPAPIPVYAVPLRLPEPRGMLSADLLPAFGQLWIVYGSSRADDSDVNRQESGAIPLGIPLDTRRQTVTVPVRAELPALIIGPIEPAPEEPK